MSDEPQTDADDDGVALDEIAPNNAATNDTKDVAKTSAANSNDENSHVDAKDVENNDKDDESVASDGNVQNLDVNGTTEGDTADADRQDSADAVANVTGSDEDDELLTRNGRRSRRRSSNDSSRRRRSKNSARNANDDERTDNPLVANTSPRSSRRRSKPSRQQQTDTAEAGNDVRRQRQLSPTKSALKLPGAKPRGHNVSWPDHEPEAAAEKEQTLRTVYEIPYSEGRLHR